MGRSPAQGDLMALVTYLTTENILLLQLLQPDAARTRFGASEVVWTNPDGTQVVGTGNFVFEESGAIVSGILSYLARLDLEGRTLVTFDLSNQEVPLELALFEAAWTLTDVPFTPLMSGNDTIIGGAADDELSGMGGTDAMFGNDGNDTLYGGGHADAMDGGAGLDLADFGRGGTNDFQPGHGVLVNLAQGVALDNYGNVDTLVSIESAYGTDVAQPDEIWSDMLVGSDVANVLYGRAGNDALLGGDGDDILIGGDGFDELTGGAGADVFPFEIAELVVDEFDVIWGFQPGIDRIELPGGLRNLTSFVQEDGYVGIYTFNLTGFFGISLPGTATVAEVMASTKFVFLPTE